MLEKEIEKHAEPLGNLAFLMGGKRLRPSSSPLLCTTSASPRHRLLVTATCAGAIVEKHAKPLGNLAFLRGDNGRAECRLRCCVTPSLSPRLAQGR